MSSEERVVGFRERIKEFDLDRLLLAYGNVLATVTSPEVRAKRGALIRAEVRARFSEKDARIQELEKALLAAGFELAQAGTSEDELVFEAEFDLGHEH